MIQGRLPILPFEIISNILEHVPCEPINNINNNAITEECQEESDIYPGFNYNYNPNCAILNKEIGMDYLKKKLKHMEIYLKPDEDLSKYPFFESTCFKYFDFVSSLTIILDDAPEELLQVPFYKFKNCKKLEFIYVQALEDEYSLSILHAILQRCPEEMPNVEYLKINLPDTDTLSLIDVDNWTSLKSIKIEDGFSDNCRTSYMTPSKAADLVHSVNVCAGPIESTDYYQALRLFPNLNEMETTWGPGSDFGNPTQLNQNIKTLRLRDPTKFPVNLTSLYSEHSISPCQLPCYRLAKCVLHFSYLPNKAEFQKVFEYLQSCGEYTLDILGIFEMKSSDRNTIWIKSIDNVDSAWIKKEFLNFNGTVYDEIFNTTIEIKD